MGLFDWLGWFRRKPPPPPPPPPPSGGSAELLAAVNAVRAGHGQPPFMADPVLTAQASTHAADMAQSGVLSHNGFGTRLSAAGMRDGSECVAQGQRSAREAVADWLADPPHRRAVLGAYLWAGAGAAGSFWCLTVGNK